MSQTFDGILRNFSMLKGLEREAYELYAKIIPNITDPVDQKILTGIMADELRHERMVQGIIELIEQPKL